MRNVAIAAVVLSCLVLGGRWWFQWEPLASAQAAVPVSSEEDIAPWIEPPASAPAAASELRLELAGTL